MPGDFFERGWCRFPRDRGLSEWVAATLPAARQTVEAPENARWRRCGGTWFAGVNVLPNDATGAVCGGPALSGQAVDFVTSKFGLGRFAWDPGQVSACYPGYPKPMAEESQAAFRYRLKRDAAHIDGFARIGPERRRYLSEHHSFLLGIPMVEADEGASPLVVWEGSHRVVRETFEAEYDGVAPADWAGRDVTETYHAVRRRIFEECRRVQVHARPGEAYLVHRLALHGISPWAENARAGPDGRMIVYFRPATLAARDWLFRD